MPSKAPTSRPKHEIYLAWRIPQQVAFNLTQQRISKAIDSIHGEVKLILATTDSTHQVQLAQPF